MPISLICIIGTAADATDKYPLDTPVLISVASNAAYAALGTAGTLQKALDDVRDQIGANVVIIRIEHSGTADELTSRMTEKVQLLRGVESVVGEKSKVLITPGFTTIQKIKANPVMAEVLSVADGLRAMVIADGTNINNTDAIQARSHYGSKRLVIVDPGVKVWDTVTNDYALARIVRGSVY